MLKDEIIKRGKVYYAKLARGKAMFLAPRMIPHFKAVWGLQRAEEKRALSRSAQSILRVLRREWETSTSDLRDESGIRDRRAFNRGMDELQAAMLMIPSEVYYQPKFTYIWTLAIGRFPDELREASRARPRGAARSLVRFSPVPARRFAASSPASRASRGPRRAEGIAPSSPKGMRRCCRQACID